MASAWLLNTYCLQPKCHQLRQVQPWSYTFSGCLLTCFVVVQRCTDDTKEDIVPLTLTDSKEGVTLSMSEQFLQHLEKEWQAASVSKAGSGCPLASGASMLHWLYRCQRASPHTTLPGQIHVQIIAAWSKSARHPLPVLFVGSCGRSTSE